VTLNTPYKLAATVGGLTGEKFEKENVLSEMPPLYRNRGQESNRGRKIPGKLTSDINPFIRVISFRVIIYFLFYFVCGIFDGLTFN
jgi:hypothetical protein